MAEKWVEVWDKDKENGISFANFFLNDFIYLYEEIIGKLEENKNLERSLGADDISHTLSPEDRKEKEDKLAENEKRMKSTVDVNNINYLLLVPKLTLRNNAGSYCFYSIYVYD